VLHLSAAAWVSVRDQAGHRLVYENLPAGTEQTYLGQAPFSVVLGNAPAAKLEFNGQAFDIPKAKAGTVAKFTLKAANH
jgi:cytoskeleton protein RodZ